ncbi:hypothetical protein AALA24_12665 [Anaerovoracaceae bacterium 42-11]
MKNKLKSEIIADFLDLIEQCKIDYKISDEKIGQADKASSDMIHSIEFCNDSRKRSKTATQLHNIRKDRRYYKDMNEEAAVIIGYLEEHKKAAEKLKFVLGEMRKVESYHENRTYKPRVIQIDEKG